MALMESLSSACNRGTSRVPLIEPTWSALNRGPRRALSGLPSRKAVFF